MKKFSLIFCLFAFVLVAFSSDAPDYLFKKLDKEIEQRAHYIAQKTKRTDSLKILLANEKEIEKQYMLLGLLADEYEYFSYPLASEYALKQLQMAHESNNEKLINDCRMRWGKLLAIKGLYKEAADSLKKVNKALLNSDQKINLFETLEALYLELATFSADETYSPYYQQIALDYCDSLINSSAKNSYTSLKYQAIKMQLQGNLIAAKKLFIKLLQGHKADKHEAARLNAMLGSIYMELGYEKEAIENLVQSAIIDLQLNIKETTALRSLATHLFQQGETELAYKYILISKENADFYGTNQRKLQVALIFPQIEGEHLKLIDKKRRQLLWSSMITILLLLLIAMVSVFVFVQFRRLRKARKEIEETNEYLHEANRIKVEYIGYYFSISTLFIERLEKLKNKMNHDLINQNFDHLDKLARDIKPKKEREKLFRDFDRIFLNIFPSFIHQYNSLFDAAEIKEAEPNRLTTAQRIFALQRIGIKEHEKIAAIMNLSINTIYTYKTREKNKSLVQNEAFEERIMAIKSV